jgi:hypothetical protein
MDNYTALEMYLENEGDVSNFTYCANKFLEDDSPGIIADALGSIMSSSDRDHWVKREGHLYCINRNRTISRLEIASALKELGRGGSSFKYTFEARQGKPESTTVDESMKAILEYNPVESKTTDKDLLEMVNEAIANNLRDGIDAGYLEALLKLKESLEG